MPAAATPPINRARDLALASIEEAFRSIGQARPERSDDPQEARDEMPKSDALTAQPTKHPLFGRIRLWTFVSIFAATCVGVIVLAWHSSRGKVEPEPVSTSSVSVKETEELPTSSAPKGTNLTATTSMRPAESQVQATSQSAPAIPMASSTASELVHQIQDIARELASVEQGIDQLKTEQSQMVREYAELAEQLKATHEIARHNVELAEDLKATQAQLTRENGGLANQLKASQDLLAFVAEQLRQNQEQVARLVTSEQKQRQRTPASPQAIANSTHKLVTTPAASPAARPVIPAARQP
jgi:hypothetical protein